MQDTMESRRLWHRVTDSLHQDDIDKATEHKRIVSRVLIAGVAFTAFLQAGRLKNAGPEHDGPRSGDKKCRIGKCGVDLIGMLR